MNVHTIFLLLFLIIFILLLEKRNIDIIPYNIKQYLFDFYNKNGFITLMLVVLCFTVLIYLNLLNIKPYAEKNNEDKEKVIIENINNMNKKRDELKESLLKGFCKVNEIDPINLEEKCNMLTKNNCLKTNCCVYINDNKCVAGDKNGPTFRDKDNGREIKINNYYFKDNCYGKCK